MPNMPNNAMQLLTVQLQWKPRDAAVNFDRCRRVEICIAQSSLQ